MKYQMKTLRGDSGDHLLTETKSRGRNMNYIDRLRFRIENPELQKQRQGSDLL